MSNGGGMGEAEQAYLDLKKKKKHLQITIVPFVREFISIYLFPK